MAVLSRNPCGNIKRAAQAYRQRPTYDDAEPVIDAGTDDDMRILLQQGDDLSSISAWLAFPSVDDVSADMRRLRDMLAYLFSDDAAKMTSVARPRIFGPMTLKATEIAAHDDDDRVSVMR